MTSDSIIGATPLPSTRLVASVGPLTSQPSEKNMDVAPAVVALPIPPVSSSQPQGTNQANDSSTNPIFSKSFAAVVRPDLIKTQSTFFQDVPLNDPVQTNIGDNDDIKVSFSESEMAAIED